MAELNKFIERQRQILASSSTFDSAVGPYLKEFALFLSADWVNFWKVDPKPGVLVFADLYLSPSFSADDLEQDSRRRLLSSGEGMDGKVWRTGQPFWSNDLVRDMMLPRSLKATNAGLVSGIWFPIFSSTITYGVIEILSRQPMTFREDIFQALMSLGKETGEYIEHAQTGLNNK